MYSKNETIEFLDKLCKKAKTVEIKFSSKGLLDNIDDIIQIINKSESGTEAYTKIGQHLSEMVNVFGDIFFREDCYDYLISKGIDDKTACDLITQIRKGQYRFPKYQITSDRLSDDFYEWAKDVLYLPSRKLIYDIFNNI
jgi:DNA polymerase III alpha subunit (gram-positive type)